MNDAKQAGDSCQEAGQTWITLSLQDGFAADSIHQTGRGLDRINSTFWQRCRAAFERNQFHPTTVLDIWDDARHCLFVPVDVNDILRQRFRDALRTGLCDAIGYTLPRDPTALPVLIPSHVWEHGELDWDKAELSGAGFAFTRVRILMAVSIFERHNLHYAPEPLGALAPFTPSDEKRELLGLAAETLCVDAMQDDPREAKSKGGAPTFRDDIKAAFAAIEKDPNWTEKELAIEIRNRVKAETGRESDKGLGNDAILGHVRKQWQRFKDPSS